MNLTYVRCSIFGSESYHTEDFMIFVTESSLGECLTAQARYAEAEPLLTSAHQELRAKLGDPHPRIVETRQRLAKLYKLWGKPD